MQMLRHRDNVFGTNVSADAHAAALPVNDLDLDARHDEEPVLGVLGDRLSSASA